MKEYIVTAIFVVIFIISVVLICVYLPQLKENFTMKVNPEFDIRPPMTYTLCVMLDEDMDPVLREINSSYAISQNYVLVDSQNNNCNCDYILYLGKNILIIYHSMRFDEVIRMMGDSPVAFCRERVPRSDGRIFNYQVLLYKRDYDLKKLEDIKTDGFDISSPIENGYPVRKKDFIVFNEDSFNGLSSFIIDFDNVTGEKKQSLINDILSGKDIRSFCNNILKFPFDRSEIDIIPRYISVRDQRNLTQQAIPRRIFQTFNSCAVPKGMRDAITSWIESNPEYSFHFYDDVDCIRFLIENFDDRVVQAYKDMVPGAFKADLWRYCVLYVYGGVYIDAKSVCVLPLKDMIRSDDTFITVVDRAMGNSKNAEIYNAFICSVPQHPILRNIIYEVVDMVERRDYGNFVLDITGPRKFGKVVYEYLGYPTTNVTRLKAGYYEVPDSSERVRLFDHRNDMDRTITDEEDRFVIFTRYKSPFMESGFLGSITGKRHYVHYWLNGKVYVDDPANLNKSK